MIDWKPLVDAQGRDKSAALPLISYNNAAACSRRPWKMADLAI
jgi:hypothetical protein